MTDLENRFRWDFQEGPRRRVKVTSCQSAKFYRGAYCFLTVVGWKKGKNLNSPPPQKKKERKTNSSDGTNCG